MPSDPKSRSKAKSVKTKGSALDREQRQLLEQQQALQEQIEAIERNLKEAPRRAAEERQRQMDAVAAAAASAPRRRATYLHSANLLDTRHVEAAAASGRTVPTRGRGGPVVLRKERVDGRKQTLMLLIALALALCWALSHFI